MGLVGGAWCLVGGARGWGGLESTTSLQGEPVHIFVDLREAVGKH